MRQHYLLAGLVVETVTGRAFVTAQSSYAWAEGRIVSTEDRHGPWPSR